MNCLQADGLIQQALDGVLTSRQHEMLEGHLAGCADCQAARDEYQALGRTATVWTRRPIHAAGPGEAFTAQVMAQIAARPAVIPLAPIPVRLRVALAAAVLVALVVCGLLFPLPSGPAPLPSDLLPRPQAALGLPAWLWASMSGLPAAAARLWRDLMAGLSASGATVWLLAGALLLNGLLYVRAARPARGHLAR